MASADPAVPPGTAVVGRVTCPACLYATDVEASYATDPDGGTRLDGTWVAAHDHAGRPCPGGGAFAGRLDPDAGPDAHPGS